MPADVMAHAEYEDDIMYPETTPFLLVHLTCVAALWINVTRTALALGLLLYVVRMFAITAGYHRYFAHRSYKTSRWFQFVLACLAQSTSQKSVLWWAAKHRHHHRHSDTDADAHSPRHRGFLYSHVGWIFDRRHDAIDPDAVPDLARYPELRFLHRFEQLPAVLLVVVTYLVGGWGGVVVGFFWSTVLLYHCTFFINSLAHGYGSRRYATGDDSRNNWWLAAITFGEGWHNNHHAYQRSARQGFRWYEIDATFYGLCVLSWIGIVWDLGLPPTDVVRNERPLPRTLVERIARQIAASFDAHRSGPCVQPAPRMPTMDELRARVRSTIPYTPSVDAICARARELMEPLGQDAA